MVRAFGAGLPANEIAGGTSSARGIGDLGAVRALRARGWGMVRAFGAGLPANEIAGGTILGYTWSGCIGFRLDLETVETALRL
jgi:hypothetical protein